MSHRSTFPPVYPMLGTSADIYKGCPKFPPSDVKTIVSVVGNSSIITHLCQHAIRHAAETIRRNDWSLADYERFEQYVRERSVVTTPEPQSVTLDVSRRDKGAGKPATHAKAERAGVRKAAKG